MEQPDLLSWRPSGDALRDAGIALVTENAGTWMDRARAVATETLSKIPGQSISGDQIRNAVEGQIGPPHHYNAWGALARWLLLRGFLLPTNRSVKSERASNHSHANPVYEVAA